jgi:hypothetical protein
VGPLGLLPGWLFSAPAIAWALALYGRARIAAAQIRRRMSPWPVVGASAAGTWTSLRRWIRAVRQRRLLTVVRPGPSDWTPRQVAQRVAATFIALAPDADHRLSDDHLCWYGAAQHGRAIVD